MSAFFVGRIRDSGWVLEMLVSYTKGLHRVTREDCCFFFHLFVYFYDMANEKTILKLYLPILALICDREIHVYSVKYATTNMIRSNVSFIMATMRYSD